jgi:catechol 2,3-dioxygenase-like lactoylglutathione lyase family enzyme
VRLATAVGLLLVTAVAASVISGARAGAIGLPVQVQVYAQGADGHLFQYLPDHQNGNIWNAYDLTNAAGGGVPVTGTPTTAADNNGLVHVYVAGPGGHLFEYVPDHQNGHIWNAYDLTNAAGGGVPVTGNPNVTVFSVDPPRVFVPGPSGHLFEYVPDHQNGHIWNAYDLTADAGGGVPTTGAPSVAFDFNLYTERVYVPGPGGHLFEYAPDHAQGNIWNAYDLTADAGGGAPVTGNPSAVTDFVHGIIRLYVPGPVGHLTEYVPDHQNGNIWNAYDLTNAAGGGAPVTGNPSAVFDFRQGLVEVYVPGPAGHLTEYVPDHQSGSIWNAYDLTNAAGGGLPITGSPSVILDLQSFNVRVYVVDPGHLAEYVPDHQSGNIWNAYDLTTAAGGGAPVTGSPAASDGFND